jgi:hypothetical protein
MRAYELGTKTSKMAVITLLLFFATASGRTQLLHTPSVPPSPAKVPAYQTVPAGFETLGFIEYASVDAKCSAVVPTTPLNIALSGPAPTPTPAPVAPVPDGCKSGGGWIQINNDVIRVPQNAVVMFPNSAMTWEEMFERNPGAVVCTSSSSCSFQPAVPGESGLAQTDTVRSPFTYEAHIYGNIVNGNYIAGLVFISQQATNVFSGFIEKIDYANATLIVNGNRVQINDPAIQIVDLNGRLFNKGRYSIGQASGAPGVVSDPRFAADQSNFTIHSTTGYPMCIPRVAPGTYDPATGTFDPAGGFDDPQCPEINRPHDATGNLIGTFTMNAPGAAPDILNPFPQDPYTEAPFEIGDSVTVVGTLSLDLQGNTYISATDIEDTSAGIYTFPMTDPAYVNIRTLIMGTGGIPNPSFPQETARQAVVIGFMTDPMRNVDISAIDIDCNGFLSFRRPAWVSNFPVEPGLPLVGRKGRYQFRATTGGTFLPPVQYVGTQVSGGNPGRQNNGLVFDEFQLPIPQFIFPEVLLPGGAPVTFNFEDFPFLVNGTGPWPAPSTVFDSQLQQLGAEASSGFSNQPIGQLNPWPGAAAPAPVCQPVSNPSPQAHALASFIANANPIVAGTLVTLQSTGSTPVTGPFVWTQVINPGDPFVTINNANSPTATFLAPVVSAPLTLTFQLTVGGNNTTNAAIAFAAVPVSVPPPETPPSVVVTSVPGNPVSSGSTVILNANGVDPSGGTLTYSWTAPPGIALTPLATDGSAHSFTAPTVPIGNPPLDLTFTVIAQSSNGLSSSTTTTVTVNPVRDTIIATKARYRQSFARLDVGVDDPTPGVRLFVTLAGPNGEEPTINPATGQPYTGEMGPVVPFATGSFALTLQNVPQPSVVTIRSSAGGLITANVTVAP